MHVPTGHTAPQAPQLLLSVSVLTQLVVPDTGL
jgi:hypothetical protein